MISFQFTTSQGGRPDNKEVRWMPKVFQFTTSQGGRHWDWEYLSWSKPFNSRPHKEVDGGCLLFRTCVDLSIHDLTRRSTCSDLSRMQWNLFQFTTSQGGRPALGGVKKSATVFQFTTSQGGRRELNIKVKRRKKLSIHDLTRRSTTTEALMKQKENLSIHDLTRRSTEFCDRAGELWRLSIHDLTRRSTPLRRRPETCSVFQFTTSQGGRHLPGGLWAPDESFNSRPHKEVDWLRK